MDPSPRNGIPTDIATWREVENSLQRYAGQVTGDPDAARDVVHDVFITYSTALSRPADERAVRPWLYKVCRNRALDWLRRGRRWVAFEADEGPDDFAHPSPSPAAEVERGDCHAHVTAAVAQLPANQREVIRLKFQAQLSYKEIAEVTGLSVTNVGFLLHTALRALRKRLHGPLELSSAPARTLPFSERVHK